MQGVRVLLCELTGDHDHSYASLPTHSDRAKHFFPGWVQHAHTAYKGQVRLGGDGGKTCRTSSASPLFIALSLSVNARVLSDL